MALKSIQLATISPINRAKDSFVVTAHSDDGQKHVDFAVTGEQNAIKLRDAIRQYADCVWHAANYSR